MMALYVLALKEDWLVQSSLFPGYNRPHQERKIQLRRKILKILLKHIHHELYRKDRKA